MLLTCKQFGFIRLPLQTISSSFLSNTISLNNLSSEDTFPFPNKYKTSGETTVGRKRFSLDKQAEYETYIFGLLPF